MKQKKLWMLAAILLICGSTVLTSCSKDDNNTHVVQPTNKEYFTLWNQCEALTALQDEPFPDTYFTFPVKQLSK